MAGSTTTGDARNIRSNKIKQRLKQGGLKYASDAAQAAVDKQIRNRTMGQQIGSEMAAGVNALRPSNLRKRKNQGLDYE